MWLCHVDDIEYRSFESGDLRCTSTLTSPLRMMELLRGQNLKYGGTGASQHYEYINCCLHLQYMRLFVWGTPNVHLIGPWIWYFVPGTWINLQS